MKTCTKCKEEKPFSEFYRKRKKLLLKVKINTEFHYRSDCKLCGMKSNRQYNEANKDRIKAYNKKYQELNKEKLKKNSKIYYRDNFERMQAKGKLYRAANKEEVKARTRKWHNENKERVRLRQKRYYDENSDHLKELNRKYSKENRLSINSRNRKKYDSDPLYKCKKLARSTVRDGFKSKNFHKKHKTNQILKCSFEYFFNYIEKQFKEGMTFSNTHLDHIVPISLGETEEEIIALNHYSNFQPLLAKDNLKKGDKLILDMISPENKIRYKEIISRAIKRQT